MASGAVGAMSVSKLGLVKHTYLGAVMAVMEQLCWSTAKNAKGIAAACAFGVLASGAGAGTGQLLQQLAVAGGIGRGQVGAMMSNMNTVVKVPGPLIFATLFGKLGQNAPFRLAALLILASVGIYSTVDKTPVDMAALAKKAAEKKADDAKPAGADGGRRTERAPATVQAP